MTWLSSLKAAASMATPGPWKMDKDNDVVSLGCKLPDRKTKLVAGAHSLYPFEEDARYIAAAYPERILKLIQAVEKMREALDSGNWNWECDSQCPCCLNNKAIADEMKKAIREADKLLGDG